MTEKEFKIAFLNTFMATWYATHYNEFCMEGWDKVDEISEAMIEEGRALAEQTWLQISEEEKNNENN